MKLAHVLFVLVAGVVIVISFIDTLKSFPVNFHFFLVIISAFLLFLYCSSILKMYKMQKIETTLSHNENIFGATDQSEFTSFLLWNQDLLDNEKIVQVLFRDYFTKHLLKCSEKNILCSINKLATSKLYNNCEALRTSLNEAIVIVGYKKFTDPCAEAIANSKVDWYPYMAIVELIEDAFKIVDTKQLYDLRADVNNMVDSYIYLFTQDEKDIINQNKMKTENQIKTIA